MSRPGNYKGGNNKRPPTPCLDCGRPTIGREVFYQMSPEIREAKGLVGHEGNGLCIACYSRSKRGPAKGRVYTSKPPVPCAAGCGVLVVSRRQDRPEGVVYAYARGLCGPCHHQAEKSDTLLDFERRARSNDEVLEEYDELRSSGVFDVHQIAERMGMTFAALDKALWRARKRGDIRGNLPHRNLRSAS